MFALVFFLVVLLATQDAQADRAALLCIDTPTYIGHLDYSHDKTMYHSERHEVCDQYPHVACIDRCTTTAGFVSISQLSLHIWRASEPTREGEVRLRNPSQNAASRQIFIREYSL
jgi:hypothetical protein